ncbi:MAG: transglutaminaseTgpA domain-containing protein [Minicystis sp.]
MILAVPLFVRARLVLGRNAERVVLALAGAAGVAVDWIAPAYERVDVLGRPWTAIALAALAVGTMRLFVAAARGPAAAEPTATPFTFLPGLVALMATGETAVGPAYGVAVVAWLGLALAAQRGGDRGRPAWRDIPRRDRLVAAGLVALGVTFAAGSVVGLPPLARWMERRILRSLGADEVGFSERMWLGSLDGLLDSDEVVMRLEGPRTDYLRGAVFDHYEIGRWGHMRPPQTHPVDVSAARAGDDRVHVTVVAGARDRYFLPRDAHAVSARGGVTANRFGVVLLESGNATEVSFATGGPPDFPVEQPTADDLDVPPALRRQLRNIAVAWTQGAETPEAKIAAIAAHLETGFTYSRSFQRRRADPILDFLLDDHKGHCEYFATATALLARSVDVPARVVVGYRVAEENVLGHYWVVREKNAHAWAEVYFPGKGFVTVDTTPADPLAQNAPHRSSWVRAVADLDRGLVGAGGRARHALRPRAPRRGGDRRRPRGAPAPAPPAPRARASPAIEGVTPAAEPPQAPRRARPQGDRPRRGRAHRALRCARRGGGDGGGRGDPAALGRVPLRRHRRRRGARARDGRLRRAPPPQLTM